MSQSDTAIKDPAPLYRDQISLAHIGGHYRHVSLYNDCTLTTFMNNYCYINRHCVEGNFQRYLSKLRP